MTLSRTLILTWVVAVTPLVAVALPAESRTSEWVTTSGEPVTGGNPRDAKGGVVEFRASALRLMRTKAEKPLGTLLVLPGGGYSHLAVEHEGSKTAEFLNAQGFDAAVLEYHIAPGGKTSRDAALADARSSWALIRKDTDALGLHAGRFGVIGYSAGGHLAARLAQSLPAEEQPDDLALVYPAYLDETRPGSVLPAVLPPLAPRRLFLEIARDDNAAWVKSDEIYAKTWIGYGGEADWRILADGGHGYGMAGRATGATKDWPARLAAFLAAKPAPRRANPALAPVPQPGTENRHAEKVTAAKKQAHHLLMIGDSITHSLGELGGRYDALRPVWRRYYEQRGTLNLGYSGARIENILWNLQNGELDGAAPKAVTLMLGTNNVDEKNYPVRSTAPEVAEGMAAIVSLIRKQNPDTKILLLRPFPGSYDGDLPTSHRLILERAGDLLKPLADDTHVFYLDVNPGFLKPDGSLNPNLFFDHLHPNGEGAKVWAEAMEPMLSKLLGDKPVPANPALAPVPKLEEDGYDWYGRHEAIVREQKAFDPDLVLIGDSITHAWGGTPNVGNRRTGEAVATKAFAGHRVLNCGFGYDRTQNVLWRLDHGELDGIRPKTVVIHIGTNNIRATKNSVACTPPEIAEGVLAVCDRVRAKCPAAKIVLMQIFPRWTPGDPGRAVIAEVNGMLDKAVTSRRERGEKIVLRDLAPELLDAAGNFKPGVMGGDNTHPLAGGYEVWAKIVTEELK